MVICFLPDSEFQPPLLYGLRGSGIQCVQREGVQCDETEADTEQPIAAPAWSSYGTRPPLRNLCLSQNLAVTADPARTNSADTNSAHARLKSC